MRTRLVLCAALAALTTFIVGCEVTQAVDIEWPAGTFVDTTSTGCPVGLVMTSAITPQNGIITAPVGTHIKFNGTVSVPTGCASAAFEWTSSNLNVVTIDASGNATVVGVGTAQVCMVLKEDKNVKTCVTVIGTAAAACVVDSVKITSLPGVALAIGGSVQLTGTVYSTPAGCATQGVTWTVSGPGTVSSSGLLTATGAGTIVVTATSKDDNGKYATFTVTVSAAPTLTGVPQTLSGSVGYQCVRILTFTPVVTGVTNPVLSVASSNPSVAGATTSGGVVTINLLAAGTTNITTSVNGTSLSATTALTVGSTNCATPGSVAFNALVNMSNGTNCAVTQPVTLNISGIDNPVVVMSASSGTVTGSGASWVYNRGTAAPGTVTLIASVTGSNQATAVADTATFTIGNTPCAGAGTFAFSPASICFSRVAGSPVTATVAVTAADMPAGTVINVQSSNSALVSVSPSSFTYPTGTLTLTLASGTTTGNVNLTLTGNGATGSLPVQVLATACPGTATTIDYTPGGGTVANTTPITLTATCVQGSGATACNPFWTSDHPELLSVRGNSTTTVNGQAFYVGTTATLTRIAAGGSQKIQICVQWSLTATSPRTCHEWTTP